MDHDETTTMNVSMPRALKAFIQERTRGRFGNVSEYFRDLIRKDQQMAEQERLEKLLLEGLESGPAEDWTDEDWARIRTRVAARLGKKK